mgnify:CR=1 FL=1
MNFVGLGISVGAKATEVVDPIEDLDDSALFGRSGEWDREASN